MEILSKEAVKISCLSCESERVHELLQVPFAGDLKDAIYGKQHNIPTYPLVRCEGCGLMFIHPMPSSLDYLSKAYQDVDFNKTQTEKDIERNQRDLDIFNIYVPGGKILDVGIGGGFFLKLAQDQGWEVYGSALNPDEASFAKDALGIQNVQAGGIENAQFPPNFFDAIHLSQVLEHLTNPRQTLQQVKAWLKPEGVILAGVPNAESFFRRAVIDLFGDKLNLSPRSLCPNITWTPPFHLVYFNPASFRRFFELSGFAILRDHSQEMTDLWYLFEASVGNEVIQAKVKMLCDLARNEKNLSREEKFRKYYPAFRLLMLQNMGFSIVKFMDEIESALDCMNCLCLAAKKSK